MVKTEREEKRFILFTNYTRELTTRSRRMGQCRSRDMERGPDPSDMWTLLALFESEGHPEDAPQENPQGKVLIDLTASACKSDDRIINKYLHLKEVRVKNCSSEPSDKSYETAPAQR